MGRADFRRANDIIHLAMDVSTTEEKQRLVCQASAEQEGLREREWFP